MEENNNKKHRKGIGVWVYSQDGVSKYFDSLLQAAQTMGESMTTVRTCFLKGKVSLRGYLYSIKELTPQEVQDCYGNAGGIRNHKELNYFTNTSKFQVGRSREERKSELKTFIGNKLKQRWLTCDKRIADMERQYLKVLIDSI